MIVIKIMIDKNSGFTSLGSEIPKAIRERKIISHMNKLKGSVICDIKSKTLLGYLPPENTLYPNY